MLGDGDGCDVFWDWLWLLTMVGDVFGDSGKPCWVMFLVIAANNAG